MSHPKHILAGVAISIVALTSFPLETAQAQDKKQPNILWLVQEDLSPWLGCYGYEEQVGHTPTIDGMAKRGVRFSRAFVPAPVCSICRSAIITGASQIRFGAHEHRSRRGEAELPLPDGMKTIPGLLKEKGYFCFNVGKTDYNFEHDGLYRNMANNQKRPWKKCPEGKPFFGQIQLKGGKLNTTKFQDKIDRSVVKIPGDYPQNDIYREVVAEHFDSARMDDRIMGGILERLKEDGLADSTIVVYFSDHGANNLVRHKQQPTEGGLHVPFIITGPDPWVPAPNVRDDLVSLLDLSATTLAWAGIPRPDWVEGRNLFAEKVLPRAFVGAARDRCDQTIDRIRTIRTDRFRYTKNYMLDRVLLQPQYRDHRRFVQVLRDDYAAGKLSPQLSKIYFGERPAEELYDVKADPAQLNNLIDNPKYASQVVRHRNLLGDWLRAGDTGAGDEPEIELKMADDKKWGRGVNVEYEAIRKDSDGDGLSDDWETVNQRDANDGKAVYMFDCGGWQTEGWTGQEVLGNIAGRQGFLDFEVERKGSIQRDGLSLPAEKNGKVSIALRSDNDALVSLSINGSRGKEVRLRRSDTIRELVLPYDEWKGNAKTIAIHFATEGRAKVEIDWIKSK